MSDTSPPPSPPFSFGSFGFSIVVHGGILDGDRVSIQTLNIDGVRTGQRINADEDTESGVTGPRPSAAFIRYTGDTGRLVQVEGVLGLEVSRAVLFADVERGTDFFHPNCAKRPWTLELDVVKGQTDGKDHGEQIDGGDGTVVIVERRRVIYICPTRGSQF